MKRNPKDFITTEVIDPDSGELINVNLDLAPSLDPKNANPYTITYERKVRPYLQDITKYRENGMNVAQIAKILDISSSIFLHYKNTIPELKEAYDFGNELLADSLETSMYQEAKGYDYTEEDVNKKTGEIVELRKHARGNGAMLKFALTNVRSEQWKNKTEVAKTTTINTNVQQLQQLSTDDLKTLLITLKNEAKDEMGS